MSENQEVALDQEIVNLANPVEQLLSGMDTEPQESSSQLTPESVFDGESLFNGFNRVQPDEPAKAEPQSEVAEKPNEEVRYQYWQSEADKAKNEVNELKTRLEAVENRPQEPVAQPQQLEESIESFPPSPDKPEQPRGFNREEAWSDPNSDSAKYLDNVDEWRDDMDEYNKLYTEYNMAILSEEKQALQDERQGVIKKQAEEQQYRQQMDGVANHLTNNYNASPEEVAKFVEVMDKPESLNVDNLFQLFRMQNGGNVPQVSQPIADVQSETPKSESFSQLKRAQQVPSPMGVLPSSNNSATTQSSEGNIMDSMVNAYNKRNPW